MTIQKGAAMSKKAWRMDEEDKVILGRYIIDTIMADGQFPKTAEEGRKLIYEKIKENRGKEKADEFFNGAVNGVKFIQNEANGTMHIAVPPREAVKEKYANNYTSGYEIPKTYKEIADGSSDLTNKEMYEFRIGDYTISHCG